MLRFLLTLLVVASFATGCHPGTGPEVRILGHKDEVVFVQVTNPASHPMRLARLDYQFLADNRTISTGEVPLDEREVPAGAAVVVEVPLDADTTRPTTLTGTLTAELDEIVRSFQVEAQIQPH
jgi:hypothetical protein